MFPWQSAWSTPQSPLPAPLFRGNVFQRPSVHGHLQSSWAGTRPSRPRSGFRLPDSQRSWPRATIGLAPSRLPSAHASAVWGAPASGHRPPTATRAAGESGPRGPDPVTDGRGQSPALGPGPRDGRGSLPAIAACANGQGSGAASLRLRSGVRPRASRRGRVWNPRNGRGTSRARVGGLAAVQAGDAQKTPPPPFPPTPQHDDGVGGGPRSLQVARASLTLAPHLRDGPCFHCAPVHPEQGQTGLSIQRKRKEVF